MARARTATIPKPILRVADCVAYMRAWRGPKADIIVTSPPYNLGKKYTQYNDRLSWQKYLDWTEEYGRHIHTIMKDDGSFFLNVGYTARQPRIPYDVLARMCDGAGFTLQNTIHWVKAISIPEKGFGTGHFQPITSDRFVNQCHEYIFHLTKDGTTKIDKIAIGAPYLDRSNITRWSHGRSIRDRGNVWYIPYDQKNAGDMVHPCEFPPGLPDMCIRLHGIKRRHTTLVYDPFSGIGSTAVACVRLGVANVSTEIDEKYVAIARQRIEDACNDK